MSKRRTPAKSLEGIVNESSKIFEKLLGSASKASKQSTSTLAGVAGGFTGMAVVYTLTFMAPIELQIAGPIGTGLGIICGVLMFRGRAMLGFERRLEQNTIAADEILRRILALPKDTPPHVREALWNTYGALNSMRAVAGNEPTPLAQVTSGVPQLETHQVPTPAKQLTDH